MDQESRGGGAEGVRRMSWPAVAAGIVASTAFATAGGAAVAAYLGASPVVVAVFCGGFNLVVLMLVLVGDRLFGWGVRRSRRPRR